MFEEHFVVFLSHGRATERCFSQQFKNKITIDSLFRTGIKQKSSLKLETGSVTRPWKNITLVNHMNKSSHF